MKKCCETPGSGSVATCCRNLLIWTWWPDDGWGQTKFALKEIAKKKTINNEGIIRCGCMCTFGNNGDTTYNCLNKHKQVHTYNKTGTLTNCTMRWQWQQMHYHCHCVAAPSHTSASVTHDDGGEMKTPKCARKSMRTRCLLCAGAHTLALYAFFGDNQMNTNSRDNKQPINEKKTHIDTCLRINEMQTESMCQRCE